jgi:hypothetical protein
VAELAVHQVESRPEDATVNINGIEEQVAGKGYLSAAVLKPVKGYEVRSYIPEKRQKGKRRGELVERSSPTATKRAGCGAATCANERTFSSGSWLM